MSKSFFTKDLQNEEVLATYLDKYFYPNAPFTHVQRHRDVQSQKHGIDISFYSGQSPLFVDEKGYMTRPTIQHTFVLELSHLDKYGNRVEGWFYDDEKQTTHYLLCWVDREPINIYRQTLKLEHLHKVEVMLVNRLVLQQYLKYTYNIDRQYFAQYGHILVTNLSTGPSAAPLGNMSKYMLSPQLDEKPLNIVFHKNEYIASRAVEAHFIVTQHECRSLM